MKFKRVNIAGDSQPTIAMLYQQNWVPLRPMLSHGQVSLSAGEERFTTDLIALLSAGPPLWESWRERIDAFFDAGAHTKLKIDGTPLLPFVPLSYRDFMLFEQHAVNASRGFARRFMPGAYRVAALYERITGKTFYKFRPARIWYEKPIYYMGNHLRFVTEGHPVAFPSYSRALDYELELGALIVRPIRNAKETEALSAVGGFVVFNDFSARDVQVPEMRSGFGPGKAKHFLNAISSVVVSADEILPYLDELKGEVKINGETVIQTSTKGMHHSLGAAIAYASLEEQLYPGEFVATGTLPGGCGMENGRWLAPGDTLTLSIDRIGELTHTIVKTEAV